MVNRERLTKLLLELVRIDSLSRRERKIALRLKRELEELGAEVEFDHAGKEVGGDTGNLIAKFHGNSPSAAPILLVAHMDTVPPGEGVKPIVDGSVIRSDGTTVLGADDKSGVAIICEVVRSLKEHDVSFGDIEVVFTICEEVGPLGVLHLDVSRLRARSALVVDGEMLGDLQTRAPAAYTLEFRVHGLEAHAGLCPECGISAIKVAAEAIAEMRLGRIDHETTANIGVIRGGLATNVVPSSVLVQGEARSHDAHKLEAQVRYMQQCFMEAARRHRLELDGKTHDARVDATAQLDFPAMNVPYDSQIVQTVLKSAEKLGISMKPVTSGGGSDANALNARGISTVALGTGTRNIHTTGEYVEIEEMVKAAELVAEIVRTIAVEGRVPSVVT